MPISKTEKNPDAHLDFVKSIIGDVWRTTIEPDTSERIEGKVPVIAEGHSIKEAKEKALKEWEKQNSTAKSKVY